MNKLLTLLCFVCTFVLVSTASALQIPPQPAGCPSVAAIHQKGIFVTARKWEQDGTYGAIQLNTYDTPESWAFVVYKIVATSSQDAINQATAVMPSLTFDSGPLYYDNYDVWACFYNLDAGLAAFAITPIPKGVVNATPLIDFTPVVNSNKLR